MLKYKARNHVVEICIGGIFLWMMLLTSCTNHQNNLSDQTLTSTNPIMYNITSTPKMVTPTIVESTLPQQPVDSIRTIPPQYLELEDTIRITQGPVLVSTSSAEDPNYLYKKTIVTIQFEEDFLDNAYLNLDDLMNNQVDNSDIQITRYIGNEITYSLYPTNNSFYYYSKGGNLDFDLCVENFKKMKLSSVEYSIQGDYFIYGGSYCVLTNEGRIALVNYVEDSSKFVGEWPQAVISLNVTVYSQKIE